MGSTTITLSSDQYQGEDTRVLDEVDWVRSYYDGVSGTVLTTLHAHTDSFLNTLPATSLKITDAQGLVLIADTFPDNYDTLTKPINLQVTYATSRNGYKELVVHLHNYEENTVTVSKVSLLSGIAESSIQPVVIEAGNHQVLLFDVSAINMGPTSVWTITLTLDDGTVSSLVED